MKTDYSGTAPQIPSISTLSRRDLEIIADMIDEGSRVLDVGCGNGALLDYLGRNKGVDGRGIELSQAGVNACVAHGLSVIQGDADTDLEHYPDDAFDFVVLTRTLQATRNPRDVVSHLVRIGRHAIVSFTNFGHWRVRIESTISASACRRAGEGVSTCATALLRTHGSLWGPYVVST